MNRVVQMIAEYMVVIGVSAFMIGLSSGVKWICREVLLNRKSGVVN